MTLLLFENPKQIVARLYYADQSDSSVRDSTDTTVVSSSRIRKRCEHNNANNSSTNRTHTIETMISLEAEASNISRYSGQKAKRGDHYQLLCQAFDEETATTR